MFKNKKIKVLLCVIELLLIVFQALAVGVIAPKGYYFIHDWIFYGLNYAIIIILCLLCSRNKYIKWTQLAIALLLFVANTTFFYYRGNVNLVISKSEDNKHELILKEYKKMNYETVRLKRRWVVFGKKAEGLMESSKYKTIEEGTYKIEWVSGDIAVVTYKTSDNSNLQQSMFSFRSTNYISYLNVAPSLTGKWLEKDNSQNYFLYDAGKIVYAKDGQLYYYRSQDTEQQGVTSIIIKGDGTKPSITVVLNSDAVIGDNCLIKDGGTITIAPITLEKSKGYVYYKK
jgi:hypothetical protein